MVDDSFGCGKSWHPCDDGKNIFIYWDKGVSANTPEVVHEALRAWRVFAQGWQICFIDGRSEPEYLSPKLLQLRAAARTISVWADLVRMDVLCSYGGCWADATTWPLAPLDDWLRVRNFSVFRKKSRPAIVSICTWFIYAPPNCEVIRMWAPAALHTLLASKKHDHLWHRKTFQKLLENEPWLLQRVNLMPLKQGHYFAPCDSKRLDSCRPRVPDAVVVKLNWRKNLRHPALQPVRSHIDDYALRQPPVSLLARWDKSNGGPPAGAGSSSASVDPRDASTAESAAASSNAAPGFLLRGNDERSWTERLRVDRRRRKRTRTDTRNKVNGAIAGREWSHRKDLRNKVNGASAGRRQT